MGHYHGVRQPVGHVGPVRPSVCAMACMLLTPARVKAKSSPLNAARKILSRASMSFCQRRVCFLYLKMVICVLGVSAHPFLLYLSSIGTPALRVSASMPGRRWTWRQVARELPGSRARVHHGDEDASPHP